MQKRVGCEQCPSRSDPCLTSGAGDKPAHLIVVAENPSGFSIGSGRPFSGYTGRMFQRLLTMIKQIQECKYASVKVYKTYAVLAGAIEPTTEHLRICQPNLIREILSVQGATKQSPVIVTLGVTALKALNIHVKKLGDVVGRVLTTNLQTSLGPKQYKVVPLFAMGALDKTPGLSNVTVAGLLQAVRVAMNDAVQEDISFDMLTRDYRFPKTIEEVKGLIDEIISYSNLETGLGPSEWFISIDTETNVLQPHRRPDPKVLMLSVAWDEGKAATILLDHKDTPYDRAEAWAQVKRLLQCPKPKGFHNWQFDRKFLEEVYGIPVHNVVWDSMLGEHFLDEDKKGLYGLKKLTPIYAPAYTGYDDDLQQILRRDKPDGLEYLEKDVIQNGVAPAGKDPYLWSKLHESCVDKAKELAKPKDQRNVKQLEALKLAILQLYKQLQLKKPKQIKKGIITKDDGFSTVPLDIILRYAAVDADVTRIIVKAQLYRLNATDATFDGKRVMKYLYLPASKHLSKMEMHGFKIDTPYLDEVDQGVTEMLVKAESELRGKFGTINYSSPPQVAALMGKMNFERLPGVDPSGTGKDILTKYVKHYPAGDPRREFSARLLEYRAAHKTKTGFLRKIRMLSQYDRRVHGSFFLSGTATGRLSSSSPNMQNLPKFMCRIMRKDDTGKDVIVHPGFNIKKLFIPANPDNVIVNVDIKGAELRVYTAYSHDEKMIDALTRGLDVHSYTTSMITGIPYETIEREKDSNPEIKTKRTMAKRVVFGIFYGAGAYKIAEQIGCSVEEAQKIIDQVYAAYPALRTYAENTHLLVRTQQFVKTHFGRYRRFRLAHTSKKAFAEACREAVNFLIQSTASDLVLSQLCEIADNIHVLQGEMLITVHDAITFEMPKHFVDIYSKDKIRFDRRGDLHLFLDTWIVKRVAEKYDWLPVPFLYDVEIGPSYGETKAVEREHA